MIFENQIKEILIGHVAGNCTLCCCCEIPGKRTPGMGSPERRRPYSGNQEPLYSRIEPACWWGPCFGCNAVAVGVAKRWLRNIPYVELRSTGFCCPYVNRRVRLAPTLTKGGNWSNVLNRNTMGSYIPWLNEIPTVPVYFHALDIPQRMGRPFLVSDTCDERPTLYRWSWV